MNYIDFDEVTTNGVFKQPAESETLEYKTAEWELPKSFWETVSSFSNTSGGLIVLGVKENKAIHEYQIVGTDCQRK